MILVSELKPGSTFSDGGELFLTLEIDRNKTAMRKMVMKFKVKNLRTGAITELNYGSGDKVEQIYLDKRELVYLYDDGDQLVFMDNETFEQTSISKEKLQWELNFLIPNQTATITYLESEVMGIELPVKVTLKIVDCPPAVRGDTVTKASKDAILETGYKIKVPLFVENGESIIVRTDNGEYDSRA